LLSGGYAGRLSSLGYLPTQASQLQYFKTF
jgi:hypothetical protein